MPRCHWPGNDPEYIAYHDHCWGMPVFNDQELFAKLCLDGQQAGLSWLTILRKHTEYERLFANFDPFQIITFDQAYIDSLMHEPGIVRNRLKINAILENAKAYVALQQAGISFSDYLWAFVGGAPIDHQIQDEQDIPTSNSISKAMANNLKKKGFKFVGETICYAFMQAVGMYNDHRVDCPAHKRCQQRYQHLFNNLSNHR
ncbi:DNA-3-methyladenine glycosylase I [Celerinatantimonas sp. YJH-8]|uniref:DNA-3-methyladenine glycosylase I n=1 Tax=Celerinatantimonas sp. YJH-8 TaxID=3228714 RepID=UPI0038C4C428